MAYKDCIKRIHGRKTHEIFLFALSTCGWCMKTKKLLNDLGVEYCYVDVDLLNQHDREEVEKEFIKMKTDFSFPKILIGKNVISGFDEEKIRKQVENGRN